MKSGKRKKPMFVEEEEEEDDIFDYDTPPSSDEEDMFVKPISKPQKKYSRELELTCGTSASDPPPAFFTLAMNDTDEAAKALICYMAYYAFLNHTWIVPQEKGPKKNCTTRKT